MAKHMLKYHVGVPLVIFVLLVAVGVPFGTAIFVGAMAGCMSMMFMMMGGQRSGDRESQGDGVSDRRDVPDDAKRGSSH
jgi:hypothetical protein